MNLKDAFAFSALYYTPAKIICQPPFHNFPKKFEIENFGLDKAKKA